MMPVDLTVVWQVMKWPLAACLILPPLLVYLGLHVVKREVIFVDLALAQTPARHSLKLLHENTTAHSAV